MQTSFKTITILCANDCLSTIHLGFRKSKSKACFKRRILHASNSIVSIMFMLSATSETIKFDVFNCGRPKL